MAQLRDMPYSSPSTVRVRAIVLCLALFDLDFFVWKVSKGKIVAKLVWQFCVEESLLPGTESLEGAHACCCTCVEPTSCASCLPGGEFPTTAAGKLGRDPLVDEEYFMTCDEVRYVLYREHRERGSYLALFFQIKSSPWMIRRAATEVFRHSLH